MTKFPVYEWMTRTVDNEWKVSRVSIYGLIAECAFLLDFGMELIIFVNNILHEQNLT